jgi:Tol biopolymer transport system component
MRHLLVAPAVVVLLAWQWPATAAPLLEQSVAQRVFPASGGTTTLVTPGTVSSESPEISADGGTVVFVSASALLPADDNDVRDTYRFSVETGELDLVSIDADGRAGDSFSDGPAISADGRYVAFESAASSLAVGDTNELTDVFLRDTLAGTTTAVTGSAGGVLSNGSSVEPDVSADGRYVAFTSSASNLVAQDANGVTDVFVKDLASNEVTRVSVTDAGAEAAGASREGSISGDGRYVAFSSSDPDLAQGDTNGVADIFVRDLVAGHTYRVSVSSSGTQANDWSGDPSIGGRGHIVFMSMATNLVAGDDEGNLDVFAYDLANASTTRLSETAEGEGGDGYSYSPNVSPGGERVVFTSDAQNFGVQSGGWGQVYRRDMGPSRLEVVSVSTDGTVPLEYSDEASISDDGRYVVFESWASLTSGDFDVDGEEVDVYIWDAEDPVSITLSRPDLNVRVGSVVSLTAQLVGFRSEYAVVVFSIDGDAGVAGSCRNGVEANGCQTDGMGVSGWSYSRDAERSDTVTAFVDIDGDRLWSAGEPRAQAGPIYWWGAGCIDLSDCDDDRLSNLTETAIGTDVHLPDTDGDGLIDSWEVASTVPGSGVEIAGGKVVPVDEVFGSDFADGERRTVRSDGRFPENWVGLLQPPDPLRKDIFLELDWQDCRVDSLRCPGISLPGMRRVVEDPMHHAPSEMALRDVVAVFAAAPVPNPSGVDGINLRIVVDQRVSHERICQRDSGEQERASHFGTSDQQGDEAVIEARAMIFRYVFSGHAVARTPTAECGVPSDVDLIASTQGWGPLPDYDESPFGAATVGGRDILVSLGPLWSCPRYASRTLLGSVCYRGWKVRPSPFSLVGVARPGIFPAVVGGAHFRSPQSAQLGLDDERDGVRQLWGRTVMHLLGHSLGLASHEFVLNDPLRPALGASELRAPERYTTWDDIEYAPAEQTALVETEALPVPDPSLSGRAPGAWVCRITVRTA